MDRTRPSHPLSNSSPQCVGADASCVGADASWGTAARAPRRDAAYAVPVFREGAETCAEVEPPEMRSLVTRLIELAALLKCGEIVVPPSARQEHIECFLKQSEGDISVGRNSQGESIVTFSTPEPDAASYFIVLSAAKVPVLSGRLVDKGLDEDWPEAWRGYGDNLDKKILDHCCGSGLKVDLLRRQGIDAHGVDIAVFGSTIREGLHYGRPNRLPFVDQSFDQVESSMGALPWIRDNRDLCREAFAEVIRVTRDGGRILFSPFREPLIRELIAERSDVSLVGSPAGRPEAFELLVRRTQ